MNNKEKELEKSTALWRKNLRDISRLHGGMTSLKIIEILTRQNNIAFQNEKDELDKKYKEELKNFSLSHGTLKNDDLIPAFAEFLEENYPVIYGEILKDENYYYILEFGNYETETAFYLLEELFEKLNELSPLGYYFGVHVGDGSDFGFWEFEE